LVVVKISRWDTVAAIGKSMRPAFTPRPFRAFSQ
jgi:hypothetical protein